MGCASSGDDIKEKENNDSENENNEKKKSSNKLYKTNVLATANSIENISTPREIDSVNLSKKEKDKTFSSSKKQLEINVNIEVNSEEDEEDKEKDKTNNLEDRQNNYNKLNFGHIPYNSREKSNKRNNIKYAILEKDDEREDNSNTKKNSKNIFNPNE